MSMGRSGNQFHALHQMYFLIIMVNRRTPCINYSVNRTVDAVNGRLRSNSFLIPKTYYEHLYVDSLYILLFLLGDKIYLYNACYNAICIYQTQELL